MTGVIKEIDALGFDGVSNLDLWEEFSFCEEAIVAVSANMVVDISWLLNLVRDGELSGESTHSELKVCIKGLEFGFDGYKKCPLYIEFDGNGEFLILLLLLLLLLLLEVVVLILAWESLLVDFSLVYVGCRLFE